MKIACKRTMIRNGVPKSPWLCPIAMAVKDTFNLGYDDVAVSRDTVRVFFQYWKLSWRARKFVALYDRYPKFMQRWCPAFTFKLAA